MSIQTLVVTLKDKAMKILERDRAYNVAAKAAPRVLCDLMTIQEFLSKRHEYSEERLNETQMTVRNGQQFLNIDDIEIYTDGVMLLPCKMFLNWQETAHVKAKVSVVLQ